MGYLTTFTIYNDGAHLLNELTQEEKDKLLRDIYNACLNTEKDTITISVKGFVNMITAQRSRHADDHTVYVHMGNCVVNINAWESRINQKISKNFNFFNVIHKFLKGEVKKFGEVLKEIKENKK